MSTPQLQHPTPDRARRPRLRQVGRYLVGALVTLVLYVSVFGLVLGLLLAATMAPPDASVGIFLLGVAKSVAIIFGCRWYLRRHPWTLRRLSA
jgi:hypothetical protein